jgi:hypothetical protein
MKNCIIIITGAARFWDKFQFWPFFGSFGDKIMLLLLDEHADFNQFSNNLQEKIWTGIDHGIQCFFVLGFDTWDLSQAYSKPDMKNW